MFTEPFIQAQIKENIKAPRHLSLCGEFTGDRWIPRTNGQQRGKCFHLMTSSCEQRLASALGEISCMATTPVYRRTSTMTPTETQSQTEIQTGSALGQRDGYSTNVGPTLGKPTLLSGIVIQKNRLPQYKDLEWHVRRLLQFSSARVIRFDRLMPEIYHCFVHRDGSNKVFTTGGANRGDSAWYICTVGNMFTST